MFYRRGSIIFLFCIVGAWGCKGGSDSIPTERVKGKVIMKGGDVNILVGAYVRLESIKDSKIRGVGEIEDNGEFFLGMFQNDRPVGGIFAGEYRVKIDLSDGQKNIAKKIIHPKFLDYSTSPLKCTIVKGDNDLTLEVSK